MFLGSSTQHQHHRHVIPLQIAYIYVKQTRKVKSRWKDYEPINFKKEHTLKTLAWNWEMGIERENIFNLIAFYYYISVFWKKNIYLKQFFRHHFVFLCSICLLIITIYFSILKLL